MAHFSTDRRRVRSDTEDRMAEKPQVLIVDDEILMRSAISRALRCAEYDVVLVGDGSEAVRAIGDGPATAFAAAVVDLQMPGMNGIETLAAIKRLSSDIRVIILTGQGTISAAVQAIQSGADDFIEKPFDGEVLRHRVWKAVEIWRTRQRALGTCSDPAIGGACNLLIGESPTMKGVRESARRLANAEVPLLVQGESGTGKEQFAKTVHYSGNRREAPFMAVDASALPPTMIESELFGHVKGAFTGADADRQGLMRTAGRGTIFLDEIGEMPAGLQTRLLRVLQERMVRPVGSDQSVAVEARLIAATNKDLAAAVKRGEFRQDLYHRLNVVSLTMPPLRDHKEDIPVLVQHFLRKYRSKTTIAKEACDQTLSVLLAYDWPGNVRELENAVLHAVVMADCELIRPEHLPLHILSSPPQVETETAGEAVSPCATGMPLSCDGAALADYERRAIVAALAQSKGNRRKAAGILRVGTATLYRKMKEHHVK
jgi:DNA-binding NtrC family response regulator